MDLRTELNNAFREHFNRQIAQPKVGYLNFELLKNQLFTSLKKRSEEILKKAGVSLDMPDSEVDLDPDRLKLLVDFTYLVDKQKTTFEKFIPDEKMDLTYIKCLDPNKIKEFFELIGQSPRIFINSQKRLSELSDDEIDDLFSVLDTDDIEDFEDVKNNDVSIFKIGLYFALKRVKSGQPVMVSTLSLNKNNCILKHLINVQYKNVMKKRCNRKVGPIKFDLLNRVVDEVKEKKLKEVAGIDDPKERWENLIELQRTYSYVRGLLDELNPNNKTHPTEVLFPNALYYLFEWIGKNISEFMSPTKNLSQLTDEELDDLLKMVGIRPKLLAGEICGRSKQSNHYLFIVGYYFTYKSQT
jgi:hypothetical protein